MKKPDSPKPVAMIGIVPLCELTGLGERQLLNHAKQGWYPIPKRGQYEMTRTIRGLYNYYRSRESQGGEELRSAKLLRAASQARSAKVAADLDERSSVKVEDAKRLFARVCAKVKTRMLGIGHAVAPWLDGLDVNMRADRIRAEIIDGLSELDRVRLGEEKGKKNAKPQAM